MKSVDQMKWFDFLTDKLDVIRHGVDCLDDVNKSESEKWFARAITVRWFVLVILGIYWLYARFAFAITGQAVILSTVDIFLLIVTVVTVCTYNLILGRFIRTHGAVSGIGHLQGYFDLLIVSILVQLSGGAHSQLWVLYLLVGIETAFLLEKKKDIFFAVLAGALLYGMLLATTYLGTFQSFLLPIVVVDTELEPLPLALKWVLFLVIYSLTTVSACNLASIFRKSLHALRESEKYLCNFLESANDLIFCITPESNFVYVNHAWQQATGYSSENLAGHTVVEYLQAESRPIFAEEMQRARAGERVIIYELRIAGSDGRIVVVNGQLMCGFAKGLPTVVWGICQDITDKQTVQEQLYHLAHHDALTLLPNRILLLDRLRQARAVANRLKLMVAVLFLDLDRFKIINDTLGHEVGDRLLQAVAKRISASVRETDTVARFGGDEFVTVLVNIPEKLDAEKIARKIVKNLSLAFQIDSHELFVTASIGISLYPLDGDEPESLIKKSDIAMYEAKNQGRNNFQFYDLRMDENATRFLTMAVSLRKALDRNELKLCYQPKVDILTGNITAMEAFLRWHHPDSGELLPAEFIPVADETGLIIPIGEWVLKTACKQNMAWLREGFEPMRVAINLSLCQLQHRSIVEMVANALEDTGMAAELLELEIAENVIMQDTEGVIPVLKEFRSLGIYISIDDFGTGYSSLSHLKRFAVNTLKIDSSFIREVEFNATDAAIASAIIAMGNSLNMRVIAEGVETEGQMSFLREKMCNEIQGYYFSKPLPPEEIAQFLRTHRGKPLKWNQPLNEKSNQEES